MRPLFLSLVLLAGGLVRGDVVSVRVGEWGNAGSGETSDGWTVGGIDKYSDGTGVYFNSVGDAALSPVYPGLVTQVVVRVKSSAVAMTRFLSLIPQRARPDAPTFRAQPTTAYQEQAFAWCPAEAVRQFSFQVVGSNSGNWGVSDVTVYLDRVEPPVNLRTGARYADAFDAFWNSEPRAVRFEAGAGRVDEVNPSYALLRRWDFSVLTNATGNTKSFEDLDPPDELRDVGGENLNLQAKSGGHLQIGKDNVVGAMTLPLPEGVGRTALMTLCRHEKDDADGFVSNLYVTAAGSVNALPNLWLTARPTVVRQDLPDEASLILVKSWKARRVRVTEVRIVSDYVEGSVTTSWVADCRAEKPECVMKGLSPGRWVWRVRAFDGNGWDSPWSEVCEVTLEGTRPRYADRGFGLIVR